MEGLHNIKSNSECGNKRLRTVALDECCIADNTVSTRDSSTESSTFNVDEHDTQGHFINFMGKNSHSGNSESHFCLHCFPNVEDKEAFRLFVEELFKSTAFKNK